jgi:release factor glutamine methyltransferase
MQNLEQLLDDFFQCNRVSLIENYPGINKKVLQDSLSDFLGTNLDLLLFPSFSELKKINTFFSKVNKGIPLAYITNLGHFYGRDFYINESVLIPRFETEELTVLAIEYVNNIEKDLINVAEVGVGSGCIGLTLVAECFHKNINLIGHDISEDALDVARTNLDKLQFCLPKKSIVNFSLSDRLSESELGCHDLIVSNPPYIKTKQDMESVHQQVKSFEPDLALFIEDDKYDDWFNTFFSQVESCLRSDGLFLMEGHENHLNDLKKMASGFSFKEIKIIKDLSQRDRILSLKKI